MSRYTDDTDGGDDRPGLDELEPAVELLGDVLDDDETDDDDEDDYPEDATEDDIDLVVALYREDGQPVAVALALELANDLDELINQLRRIPGDAGAVGLVSIASEFFVIVRVRGKKVQVLLSDELAATDWPIARDVADFLGSELPEDEDDAGPIGDLDIFGDVGLQDFELEALCDSDDDSDVLVERIVKRLNYGPQYRKTVQTSFGL
ncbi:tRNA adenosine deaminase-associated protein [Micropruina sonneratiae]|uniref:tRNA adenosine deaminase-associated protein n=1 Tax=Micropruina sonneratiae TaxID=2986940 RepID=UPI002227A570|nr:tRNA adenosine deaminase-associated protein [Micropruina sp. KQZ13P-5]MCW3159531.1 tRNA adenosine deaminase-associated protein [Micropruina sp. KQZ13P-5]